MILGAKARYAVMAMAELAGRGGDQPVTLAEIAQTQEIPLPYLEQIFNKLKKNGLVKAVRGPGGGYLLARPAAETWISDIVLAVEESLKMTRCEKDSGAGCMHRKTRCVTHDLWEGLGEQIYTYLRGISLENLCQAPGARGRGPGIRSYKSETTLISPTLYSLTPDS